MTALTKKQINNKVNYYCLKHNIKKESILEKNIIEGSHKNTYCQLKIENNQVDKEYVNIFLCSL